MRFAKKQTFFYSSKIPTILLITIRPDSLLVWDLHFISDEEEEEEEAFI